MCKLHCLKVTCRGRISPVHRTDHHHHHIWWLILATSVGPTDPLWVLSTPLLPGCVCEPLVWPISQWTPPYLDPQVCPQTASVLFWQLLICSFLAYWCLFVGCNLLNIVPKTQRNQSQPLWTPHFIIWAKTLHSQQKSTVGAISTWIAYSVGLNKSVFVKVSCF